MYSRHYCQILIIHKFSQQIIEIYSNIKFHENLSNGIRVVPSGQTDGRTDRHDQYNSRFFTILRTHLKSINLLIDYVNKNVHIY
jgi:hypothetical protein